MENLNERIKWIRKKGGYVLHLKSKGGVWSPVEVEGKLQFDKVSKWWEFWK